MTVLRQYVSATSVSMLDKIINIASAVLLLWFLNALLGKEQFGVFMLALTIVTMTSLIVFSPFSSLLLYKISRLEDKTAISARRIAATLLLGGAFLASLAMGGIYTLTPFIADLADKPGLLTWLRPLSVIVVLQSALFIMTAWYRARQNIITMTILQDITPLALRAVLLGIILWLGFDAEWATAPYILAFAIPLSAALLDTRLVPRPAPSEFTRWDVSYALKNMLQEVINKPARSADILVVGMLASAVATADYVMASRLSVLLLLGQQILAQLLVPRMGHMAGQGDHATLYTEYDTARALSFASTLMGAGVILLAAPLVVEVILPSFGDYESAFPLLIALAAAHVGNTVFGSLGGLMAMMGHAGWNLVAGITNMVVTFGLSLLLVPVIGPLGGAVGLLAGKIIMQTIMVVTIYVKDSLLLMTTHEITVAVLSTLILFVCVFWPALWAPTGVVLFLMAFYILGRNKILTGFVREKVLKKT